MWEAGCLFRDARGPFACGSARGPFQRRAWPFRKMRKKGRPNQGLLATRPISLIVPTTPMTAAHSRRLSRRERGRGPFRQGHGRGSRGGEEEEWRPRSPTGAAPQPSPPPLRRNLNPPLRRNQLLQPKHRLLSPFDPKSQRRVDLGAVDTHDSRVNTARSPGGPKRHTWSGGGLTGRRPVRGLRPRNGRLGGKRGDGGCEGR